MNDMRGDRDVRGGMPYDRGNRDMRGRHDMRGDHDIRGDRDMRGGRDMRGDRDMRDNNYGTEFSQEDMRSAPLGYSRGGRDEHGWATGGFRDTTSRGGFGGRGQFDRLRDQNGRLIDEYGDRRHYYAGGADSASRSEWRAGTDISPRRYTDEDDDDRRTRGYRGDIDNRSRQFIGDHHDDDDMRGQFRRSRFDGELGRRGSVGEVRYLNDPRRGEHQYRQGTQMPRDDREQRDWYDSQDRGFRSIDDMRDMHGSGGMAPGERQHGREYGRDDHDASGADIRRTNEWTNDVRRTNQWDRDDVMSNETNQEEPEHHVPRGASSIDNPNQGADAPTGGNGAGGGNGVGGNGVGGNGVGSNNRDASRRH
jgi:hypothetical protein